MEIRCGVEISCKASEHSTWISKYVSTHIKMLNQTIMVSSANSIFNSQDDILTGRGDMDLPVNSDRVTQPIIVCPPRVIDCPACPSVTLCISIPETQDVDANNHDENNTSNCI